MKWLYLLPALLPLTALAQKKNVHPVAQSQPAPCQGTTGLAGGIFQKKQARQEKHVL
jgi:hypothetical protein